MSKNRLKKGFTIIELIVVIAILGVLVLLAAPKFLGYTTDAKVANVKNDIAAYENAIEKERIDDDKYIKDWEKVDVPTMESLKNSLFTKKGLITESNNVAFEGEYYKIPKGNELVKTSLKGDFYLGQGGEVYYYDEKLASKVLGKSSANEPPVVEPEPEPPAPIETFKVTFKDYYGEVIETKTVEKGKSVTAPVNPVTGRKIGKWDKDLTSITSNLEVKPVVDGPTDKELGYSKADFTWEYVGFNGYIGLNKEKGYFKYTGTGRSTVEVPHVIQGVPITSYWNMFYEPPAEVTKVISTNKNVTDMSGMFAHSKSTSLDLSEFDTSNVKDMSVMFYNTQAENITFGVSFNTSKVTNMYRMFSISRATILDVSKFNTSNVTNMREMFAWAKAPNLDVSNFNTSKVKDMDSMFYGSKATNLDVSNFNTSNVTDMDSMFYGSKATNLDVSNFNTSNVKYMDSMFKEVNLEVLYLTNFDTSNVIKMNTIYNNNITDAFGAGSGGLFEGATIGTLKIDGKFNTSKVTSFSKMFYNATIGNIVGLENLDVSNGKQFYGTFDRLTLGGIQDPKVDLSKWKFNFTKIIRSDDLIPMLRFHANMDNVTTDTQETKDKIIQLGQ